MVHLILVIYVNSVIVNIMLMAVVFIIKIVLIYTIYIHTIVLSFVVFITFWLVYIDLGNPQGG